MVTGEVVGLVVAVAAACICPCCLGRLWVWHLAVAFGCGV